MAKIEVMGFALKKYKQIAENVAKETIKLMKQPSEMTFYLFHQQNLLLVRF